MADELQKHLRGTDRTDVENSLVEAELGFNEGSEKEGIYRLSDGSDYLHFPSEERLEANGSPAVSGAALIGVGDNPAWTVLGGGTDLQSMMTQIDQALEQGETPSGVLLRDGSTTLTANWDVGGFDISNIGELTLASMTLTSPTGVQRDVDSSHLVLSGGNGSVGGGDASIELYGNAEVSNGGDLKLKSGNTDVIHYDRSTDELLIIGNSPNGGAGTHIRYSGSGRFIFENGGTIESKSSLTLTFDSDNNTSAATWKVTHGVGKEYVLIDPNNFETRFGETGGANILLYDGKPDIGNDIFLRDGSTNVFHYDSSFPTITFEDHLNEVRIGPPFGSVNLVLTGHLRIEGNSTAYGDGRIFKNAADGLVIEGVAGTTNDLALLTSGELYLVEVPTGTLNWNFSPGVDVKFLNQVLMPSLTTSDPAVAGQLWNDSGTVKISAG